MTGLLGVEAQIQMGDLAGFFLTDQLNGLIFRGLEHAREGKGMAFIEVLSPCVTYNDTYPEWMNRVHDVDTDPAYDRHNRGQAFARLFDLSQQSLIPIGLIFHSDHASLQSAMLGEVTPFHSLDGVRMAESRQYMDTILAGYAV